MATAQVLYKRVTFLRPTPHLKHVGRADCYRHIVALCSVQQSDMQVLTNPPARIYIEMQAHMTHASFL